MVAVGVVMTLLLVIVAGSGLRLIEARDQQKYVINDFYQALFTSSTFFYGLVNVEDAVRGYALTSDRATLRPMLEAKTPGQLQLARTVRESIPDQAEAIRQAQIVEDLGTRWYQEWAVPSVRTIDAAGTLTPAEVNDGKVLFDRLRDAYTTYITTVRTARNEAADDLSEITNRMFFAVVMEALITGIGGVALWRLLRRWVSRPVSQLGHEVRLVSDGDLDHEVRAEGPPEFESLAADVDRMRRALVSQIAQVQAAGVDLREAQARLEQERSDLARSNRDLEQFAYVASHDLQEPLRKVASFCQLLERRYAGQLDERADQYIHFAVDGAKRMQQLINDLLDFSRVGRQAVQMSRIGMDECLSRALANLETAVAHEEAVITSDPLPEVLGEPGLLVQLLQNLIGNAMKFRSDEAPAVHLGVRRVGQDWEFSCRDNGIGIDPAYSERVFMIFQRLHPKDLYSGTGIGLALCKRIVEYHGGRIWVDAPEQDRPGTTVRWTLPTRGPGEPA